MTDSEEYEVACQARMKPAHFRRKNSSLYNIVFLLGQLPFPMIIKNAFLSLVKHNLGRPPDQ